ncbi:RAMP superfamily CRISPR-associated protein, partial [Methanopyrus sp.]
MAGTVTFLGEVLLRTGTRIGTSEEEIVIGGLDNPVIKDPVTGHPYLPGSSLKGRARALFELAWMRARGVEPEVFFGKHHNERHECGFVRR